CRPLAGTRSRWPPYWVATLSIRRWPPAQRRHRQWGAAGLGNPLADLTRDPAVSLNRRESEVLNLLASGQAKVALLDGVAERVVEHRSLAPLRRPSRRLPGQGPGAGPQRQPHGRRVLQLADRQRGAFRPVQGGGDLRRGVGVAGGGVERPGEQRPPQHFGLGCAVLFRGERD